MALKKPTTNTAAAAFEDVPSFDESAEVAAAAPAAQPEVATPAAPAPTASTAVAPAASTAVTVNTSEEAKRFQREFDEMRGAASFDYGTFPIYKAINGSIRETGQGKTASFGRWVKVRMLAWDDSYQIGPGVDGSKAKDFVGFSKDGKTVDSVIGEDLRHFVGKPVTEYLDFLRNEGYDKAESKRYVHTACAVLDSEDGTHEPGQIVQVTLSQSSLPSFSAYQEKLKTAARAVAMGIPGFSLPADPFTFFYICEAAAKGSNNWTKLKVESQLPKK